MYAAGIVNEVNYTAQISGHLPIWVSHFQKFNCRSLWVFAFQAFDGFSIIHGSLH